MMSQPQLLALALEPKDIVYTPDDVARDVVEFFKPSGKILEPCAGDGAFLRYLPPDTEWCEIEKGRDFFAEHRHFDWIVGNPPYAEMTPWLEHSFELAPLFFIGRLRGQGSPRGITAFRRTRRGGRYHGADSRTFITKGMKPSRK